MKIPQLTPWIGNKEYKAIKSCFDNNWVTEGPKTREFNEALLRLIGAKYGVFAPNGTLALYLGLRALGIGVGDEVIVPSFTFIASATSVEMTGAKPVFVDVNRRNFQIDVTKASRLINSKTKAIMPVHVYGTVCDMDSVMKFSKKFKLLVIEDAAEAIGVHLKNKHAGTFGDIGCFSFFADKTITTGEGGFVVTDDEKLYEKLTYLRNQGRKDRGSFIHPFIGYNFRITDIQAAVGLAQLKKLEEIKVRKRKILDRYKRLLGGMDGITFFEPDQDAEIVPFRTCILLEKAHKLMNYLREKGVESRTFFYPLHKQPCFIHLQKERSDQHDEYFPNTIFGFEHGVCLPVFPTLTDRQIAYICNAIIDFQKKHERKKR
ncbi:MAG: DegT/DnrJ/EryC1/StrS family aminotransferase [Candidatus Levybacteria bacterium]|nr:DegT/DnrJ/EryC1/StrS family aminotransferase [Candidatus Levybacteria bacterium]